MKKEKYSYSAFLNQVADKIVVPSFGEVCNLLIEGLVKQVGEEIRCLKDDCVSKVEKSIKSLIHHQNKSMEDLYDVVIEEISNKIIKNFTDNVFLSQIVPVICENLGKTFVPIVNEGIEKSLRMIVRQELVYAEKSKLEIVESKQ